MNEKELKEKIVRLQNFHIIKDKKLKLFEEERERHNKLIAKQKERINRAIKYIEKESYFYYKDNEEVIDRTPVEHLLDILRGDKE